MVQSFFHKFLNNRALFCSHKLIIVDLNHNRSLNMQLVGCACAWKHLLGSFFKGICFMAGWLKKLYSTCWCFIMAPCKTAALHVSDVQGVWAGGTGRAVTMLGEPQEADHHTVPDHHPHIPGDHKWPARVQRLETLQRLQQWVTCQKTFFLLFLSCPRCRKSLMCMRHGG